MIPHERSLVEKLQNRPFALIGVNSDQNLEQARSLMQEQKMTWRHFYDQAGSGSIATAWCVHSWPTLYYIDHQGVIRHQDVRREDEMERVLEEMVTAAEQDAGGRKPEPKKKGDPRK
ncbi:MAG TPA: hypothetical protein VK348_08455 [Planctomycetota bacterium]|nr:hypothetical protein [Planctomycetota bacterium]